MTQTLKRLQPWIATVIGIGLIAVGVRWIGVHKLADAFARQSPARVAIAFVAIALSTVLGAWNVYRIAELRSFLTFRAFLPIFWRSWAIGLTIPGQVGDMASTVWQLRGRSGNLSFLTGRLIADKIVSIGVIAFVASLLPALIGHTTFPESAIAPAVVVIGFAVGFVLARTFTSKLGTKQRGRWRTRAEAVAHAAAAPGSFIAVNAVITCAKLLLTGIAYFVLLGAAHPSLRSFIVVLAITQGAGLVAYIPVSINGLGTVELSAVKLFDLAGYAAADVLASYVLLRAASLAAAWLGVGAIAIRRSFLRRDAERADVAVEDPTRAVR